MAATNRTYTTRWWRERCRRIQRGTSSSAIANRPRDALSQLKSCQLLHNCTKITFDYRAVASHLLVGVLTTLQGVLDDLAYFWRCFRCGIVRLLCVAIAMTDSMQFWLFLQVTDFDEIWHGDAVWPCWAFRLLKFTKNWKSKMVAAAILKNRKIDISWP